MSRKKHKQAEAEAEAAAPAPAPETAPETPVVADEAPVAETGSLSDVQEAAAPVEEAPAAEEAPAEAATAVLDAPAPKRELDDAELQHAIESLLFITDQPLGLSRLCAVLGIKDSSRIEDIVRKVRAEYEARGGGLQLLEIAEGFQLATRPDFAPFVRKLYSERMTMRLSTAALETLAIVAYKQPLTRAEIEEIRGVEVIAAIETLLEKRLIKVVGRKETVGRPLLYGTTPEFLRQFGLRSAADLPPIDSFTPAEPALPQAKHGPFAGTAQLVEAGFAEAAAERPAEDLDESKATTIEEAAREAVSAAPEPVAEGEPASEPAAEGGEGLADVARRALEEEPGQG
ncbi:MAG TPA: SMC-Scp complex subunit ScpB [Elusimicrobiota bacterium]|jgi:segregation and condensation protein B|nr:SMC-Scp complex subunit ScpB [Elusimicrobiota bacterium]